METNAERAADDPAAIAYLGELDLGGSAVSLPVTNRAGLLQVSPADGLDEPHAGAAGASAGWPRALLPRTACAASCAWCRTTPSWQRRCCRMTRERGARHVAVLYTDGFAERELAGILADRLRRDGRPATMIERVSDDADATADLVRDVAERSPQAILFAGVPGAAAGALVADLARSLPAYAGARLGGAGGAGAARRVRAAPRSPACCPPSTSRRAAAGCCGALGRGAAAPAGPRRCTAYDAMRAGPRCGAARRCRPPKGRAGGARRGEPGPGPPAATS